jgi:hypothetical protein
MRVSPAHSFDLGPEIREGLQGYVASGAEIPARMIISYWLYLSVSLAIACPSGLFWNQASSKSASLYTLSTKATGGGGPRAQPVAHPRLSRDCWHALAHAALGVCTTRF